MNILQLLDHHVPMYFASYTGINWLNVHKHRCALDSVNSQNSIGSSIDAHSLSPVQLTVVMLVGNGFALCNFAVSDVMLC